MVHPQSVEPTPAAGAAGDLTAPQSYASSVDDMASSRDSTHSF